MFGRRPPIPEHIFHEVAKQIVDREEAAVERIRAAERERIAAYFDRAAKRQYRTGLLGDRVRGDVWAEAAEWCRDPSVWDASGEEADPELAELDAAAGDTRCRFWVCPIREHRDRVDGRGWPVVTVEWVGGVARCTAPGCIHDSKQPSPE